MFNILQQPKDRHSDTEKVLAMLFIYSFLSALLGLVKRGGNDLERGLSNGTDAWTESSEHWKNLRH